MCEYDILRVNLWTLTKSQHKHWIPRIGRLCLFTSCFCWCLISILILPSWTVFSLHPVLLQSHTSKDKISKLAAAGLFHDALTLLYRRHKSKAAQSLLCWLDRSNNFVMRSAATHFYRCSSDCPTLQGSMKYLTWDQTIWHWLVLISWLEVLCKLDKL